MGLDMTQMWYDEIGQYSYNNPGFSEATGHFTQVVWKSSTDVGCGIGIRNGDEFYGVAQYTPPGNYQGEYTDNVPQPV